MRLHIPRLQWLVLLADIQSGVNVRQFSTGVDNLQRVLQQLRSDVETEARSTSTFIGSRRQPTADGSEEAQGVAAVGGADERKAEGIEGLQKTAVLIKELLRIFTRKVPGGLVPDGLVRGFMQAYRELKGPQDRLAFLILVAQEMGISVTEVSSAVRLWPYAALMRPPSLPAADADATMGGQSTSSAGNRAVGGSTTTTTTRPPLPAPTRVLTVAAVPAAAAAVAGTGGGDGGSFGSATELSSDTIHRVADRIISACRPLYTQLFLPISQAPGGMKFLVDLRADLLLLLEAGKPQPSPPPPPPPQQQQRTEQQSGDTSLVPAAPLRAMAEHLRQSLAEWFSIGLLHLQPISWEDSSAAMLERVMQCEAVHPLSSWEELRKRLGPRRRVFAFTHPCMPGEPLVVLHTALLTKPAAAMSDILDERVQQQQKQQQKQEQRQPPNPSPPLVVQEQPTTAVFYSISSSQSGLRGIDLGQFLIKRAAERLMAEHPTICSLVTLSPLPNYRAWLVSRLRQEESATTAPPPPPLPSVATAQERGNSGTDDGIDSGGGGGGGGGGGSLLRPQEAKSVVRLAVAMRWTPGGAPYIGGGGAGSSACGSGGGDVGTTPEALTAAAAAALRWLLEGDRWLLQRRRDHGDPAVPAAGASSDTSTDGDGGGGDDDVERVLRPLLMRLAARYLAAEKRRRFALCPVAHFHLRNGASIWRLNWRADMSPLGRSRSFGIMVNYEYDLPCVYDNNWKYIMLHKVPAHSQVLELL